MPEILGILCGLQSEAKIARRIPGAIVACAAARPGMARELAWELVGKGATRLMSFGIAGALDPSLKLGDLVIGKTVVAEGTQTACDAGWAVRLGEGAGASVRPVYGSETLVARSADKGRLFRETGCAIVDMESQCLAEIAAAHNLPLAVVRAVCDTANMNLPPFLMAAIDKTGGVKIGAALGHLARHPSQLPDLLHVMQGTGRALKTLRRFVAGYTSRDNNSR